MNRCTSDFLLFTDRGQSFSDIKILSHFQMDSGVGILIFLFAMGGGVKTK